MLHCTDTYDALAEALAYPDAEIERKLNEWEQSVSDADPAFRQRVFDWSGRMRGLSPEEREEIYTRTFDLSPQSTLELGWHLFGEAYDRGTFLVWMRSKLREYSISETTDLPDHVRHVLPVLGRMDDEAADRFSRACVLPALLTVRDGLRGKNSPYEDLLAAICDWLESRHGPAEPDPTPLPILQEQHAELLRAEEM